MATFFRTLNRHKILLNKTVYGLNLLAHACSFENQEIIDGLLLLGADPNFGIFSAVLTCNIETIDKLIIHGADLNIRNENGERPIYFCFYNSERFRERELLFFSLLERGH